MLQKMENFALERYLLEELSKLKVAALISLLQLYGLALNIYCFIVVELIYPSRVTKHLIFCLSDASPRD